MSHFAPPARPPQRHQLQHGRLVLTRPGDAEHMRANLHDVAGFELGADEMAMLDALPWLAQDCQPARLASGRGGSWAAAAARRGEGWAALPLLREVVPRCCEPLGAGGRE